MAIGSDLDIVFSVCLAPIWRSYLTDLEAITSEYTATLRKVDDRYLAGKLSHEEWIDEKSLQLAITQLQRSASAHEAALRISDELAMQLG